MKEYQKGSLVEIDGQLAVVVGIEGEDDFVPEDHIAVWFGDPKCKRISEGGTGMRIPEVWTIPTEYFVSAQKPEINH